MNLRQSTYLGHVVHWLARYVPLEFVAQRLVAMSEVVVALALLDLEAARPVLEACYCPRRGGRPARDPVAMLRCVVLMALLGRTSFNRWAAELKGKPELVILAGFAPDDAPGVGTFYDFCHRLLDGPYQRPCAHVERPSQCLRGTRGRYRRALRAEKQAARARRQAELAHENEAPVQAAVRRVRDGLGKMLRSTQLLDRVEEILMRCAVIPSAGRGLLGDLRRLPVAGDGTPLESGAARHGKPLCDCRERGEASCECERLYSDPFATWGWDSHRERFYFGHRLHALTTSAVGVDLPLHLAIVGAHEPDVLVGVDAVARFRSRLAQFLPEARIGYGLFDAGYDAGPFYRLLLAIGATPVIPLAKATKTPLDGNGVPRAEDGTPLCSGGARKWRHSYNKQLEKLVFACPAKRQRTCDGKKGFVWHETLCPNRTPCEPNTKMGPLTLLPIGDDPRLNPPLARDSQAFRGLYDQRSGAERIFSQTKVGGGLGDRPWRRPHLFLLGALAHALAIHARAWVREQTEGRPADAEGLLACLARLAASAEAPPEAAAA